MVNGVVVVKVRRLTDASVVALMAALAVHPRRVILRPQDRLVCLVTSKSCTTKPHYHLDVAYAK